MPIGFRWLPRLLGVGLLGVLLGAPPGADAQPTPYNLKYRSGQTVQPVFEGWSRSPDGSFALHFGYFNRNFVEEVQVPVGPDNHFEPGEGDVGQPTYFYPRAHRRVFSFTVPSDFGDRRVVWNLTVQGEQLRAVGWLETSWETGADAPGGRQLSDEAARNTAPGIAVDSPSSVTVQSGATLRARVTDDGLPVQRERGDADRGPGSNDPPTLQADPDAVEAPHNVPAVPNRRGGGGGGDGPRVRGLRVSWIVWRGPAGVSFEPSSTVAVEDGQAVVTATFTTPGDYVLRAVANDDRLTTEHDVTVTVR
jgi:hypothetical protein